MFTTRDAPGVFFANPTTQGKAVVNVTKLSKFCKWSASCAASWLTYQGTIGNVHWRSGDWQVADHHSRGVAQRGASDPDRRCSSQAQVRRVQCG